MSRPARRQRVAARVSVVTALLAALPAALGAQQIESRGALVRSVAFEGNRAIDDVALSLSIATSQSSWFARAPVIRWVGLGEKRYLNELEFRRDVLRLQALYRQSGFVSATVDTIVRRTPTDVSIRFRIHEGTPVRVASLDVTGIESRLDTRRLIRELPLQPGDPFNRLLMQASADSIRVRLANEGHPFAEIFRNFDVDARTQEARITLDVVPGPRTRVGRVDIAGASAIDENVVRRTLAVRPGELFRQRDLYQSQLDLYRMEVFTYVTVGLADTAEPDSTVHVRVQVAEGALRRLRVGVGYGTVDCFRTLTNWTVHDFRGGGRTLQLNARLAQLGAGDPLDAGFAGTVCPALADEDTTRLKLNYNLAASIREPFFFSRRTSALLSVFAERRSEFQAYLRQAVGGDVALTLRARADIPVTLGYGLSYGSTIAEAATYCSYLNVCREEDTRIFTDNRLRAGLSATVVRDRRNSILDPTRGSRVTLEVRHASRFIGSDSLSQFNKVLVEYASHHRLGRRSVFSWRARVGTIVPSELGLTGSELRFVPPEERFYAGGPNSVRGYGQNEMGPVVRVLDLGLDTTVVGDSVVHTSPIGGNDLILFNAEVRFPLPGFGGRLSGAAFVDAGRLFSRETEQPNEGLRVTPGAGLRVISPLGPIRLDVAVNPYPITESPLYVRHGTSLERQPEPYRPDRSLLNRIRVHFSVGQAF